jgi:hypothetical protein
LPADLGASRVPPVSVPAAVYVGLDAAGVALMKAHVETCDDWTPKDLGLLRQAAEARDRQVALAALIQRDGVAVDGKPHPLLRAERQAGAAVVSALRALDIQPPPVAATRKRA